VKNWELLEQQYQKDCIRFELKSEHGLEELQIEEVTLT
jgi:hypothetical protein